MRSSLSGVQVSGEIPRLGETIHIPGQPLRQGVEEMLSRAVVVGIGLNAGAATDETAPSRYGRRNCKSQLSAHPLDHRTEV